MIMKCGFLKISKVNSVYLDNKLNIFVVSLMLSVIIRSLLFRKALLSNALALKKISNAITVFIERIIKENVFLLTINSQKRI